MTIAENYDAVLLDLDGTVWEGGDAIPGAVEAITASGLTDVYVTNNASRAPETVAEMLSAIGLDATSEKIVTSAQAAVELVRAELEPGTPVLVLGADTLRQLAADAGLKVVDSADEQPAAVLQGHDPRTGWEQLSEAALAIHAGARFIATNLDTTLPMQRGLMVGNGSMVAAVVSATGVTPLSAGKPEAAMFDVGARRFGAKRPLAVGDRLNTDIQGGNAAGLDTLQVLTGVSGAAELLAAPPEQRPTYIADDMSGLFAEPAELEVGAQGGFTADVEDGTVVLRGGNADSTPTQGLRTVLAAAWRAADAGEPASGVRAEGTHAERAAKGWRP